MPVIECRETTSLLFHTELKDCFNSSLSVRLLSVFQRLHYEVYSLVEMLDLEQHECTEAVKTWQRELRGDFHN